MPKRAVQFQSADGFLYLLDVETGRWGQYRDGVTILPKDVQEQVSEYLINAAALKKAQEGGGA